MDSNEQHVRSEQWRDATAVGPVAQAELLVEVLEADDSYADSTARRLGRTIVGLGRWLAATGLDTLTALDAERAAAFVHAVTRRGNTPAVATMHLRRTAIRLAVQLLAPLDIGFGDPTAGMVLPTKDGPCGRPLTVDELTLLRVAAASRNRRRGAAVAAVALSEAGATTGEVARLVWDDMDLDSTRVRLPGVGNTQPRTVELTPWGVRMLDGHRRNVGADPGSCLVVYRGTADPACDTAQAAITTRLRKLMTVAGLDDDGLRPGSIRLCLPAQRLDSDGRIDLAARQLGMASLDVAARQLHWHWDR